MRHILHFQARGEWYKVKENGDMIQHGNRNNKWDSSWRLEGIAKYWNGGLAFNTEDLFLDPDLMIGGYVFDVDHGTHRMWAGSYCGHLPRVTAAYIDFEEVRP